MSYTFFLCWPYWHGFMEHGLKLIIALCTSKVEAGEDENYNNQGLVVQIIQLLDHSNLDPLLLPSCIPQTQASTTDKNRLHWN